MPGYYIVNGKFFRDDEPSIHPDNRNYRYGDGLFETIRCANGSFPLWDLHMDRLFSGLHTLKIETPRLFTPALLAQQAHQLIQKNNLSNARIRISVSRGEGGILEPVTPAPQYSIQSWELDEPMPRFNQNGLRLGIYREAEKSPDALANLKSNNYLLYVMAAIHARENKLNDALVLNTHQRIADSSIANICWVNNGMIHTTPASEGPVSGVMLRWLRTRIAITDQPLDMDTLRAADEVFLTNAVRGVQWVTEIDDISFHENSTALKIYSDLIAPVFS